MVNFFDNVSFKAIVVLGDSMRRTTDGGHHGDYFDLSFEDLATTLLLGDRRNSVFVVDLNRGES